MRHSAQEDPAGVAEIARACVPALALGGTSRPDALVIPKPWLRVYKVPSGSMEPTLTIGERVFVEEPATSPQVGEIVIFHPPEGAEHGLCGPKAHQVRPGGAACARPFRRPSSLTFVKRIVAGPSDTIYIKHGHVYRDGRREADPYIRRCGKGLECDFPVSIKVPAHSYYLLGDNRGDSEDSRFYGAIPRSWIIGKVRVPRGINGTTPLMRQYHGREAAR